MTRVVSAVTSEPRRVIVDTNVVADVLRGSRMAEHLALYDHIEVDTAIADRAGATWCFDDQGWLTVSR